MDPKDFSIRLPNGTVFNTAEIPEGGGDISCLEGSDKAIIEIFNTDSDKKNCQKKN